MDEHDAAAMCYTSGTTGNPKGVVYSHRSAWLHSLAVSTGNVSGIDSHDRILPIVPMFHANAWGLAYAALMNGASLCMPDRWLQAEPMVRFIQDSRPTMSGAVPTVWNDVLHYLDGIRRCKADRLQVPLVLDRLFQRHRECRVQVELGRLGGDRRAARRSCGDRLGAPQQVRRRHDSLTRFPCSAFGGIGSPVMIISAALDGPMECARMRRHAAAADPAELDLGRGELRVFGCDADVAGHRGLQAAAEGIAVDGADRGFSSDGWRRNSRAGCGISRGVVAVEFA